MATGTAFTVAVNPKIPRRLARLEELANDLWYSWDRSTRSLFPRLNPGLWGAGGHNPKAFLKRVDESLLLRAAEDQGLLGPDIFQDTENLDVEFLDAVAGKHSFADAVHPRLHVTKREEAALCG